MIRDTHTQHPLIGAFRIESVWKTKDGVATRMQFREFDRKMTPTSYSFYAGCIYLPRKKPGEQYLIRYTELKETKL